MRQPRHRHRPLLHPFLLALLTALSSCHRTPEDTNTSAAFSREELLSYEQRAAAGDSEAEYMLGVAHQQGLGVPVDLKKAADWFHRAAEHGHDRAEVVLGALSETGEGVDRNLERAVHWYGLAARRGLADAQFNLARLLDHGDGIASNKVQALQWYLLAARGQPRVKEADVEVTRLVAELSPAEVANARQAANDFRPNTNRAPAASQAPSPP